MVEMVETCENPPEVEMWESLEFQDGESQDG